MKVIYKAKIPKRPNFKATDKMLLMRLADINTALLTHLKVDSYPFTITMT